MSRMPLVVAFVLGLALTGCGAPRAAPEPAPRPAAQPPAPVPPAAVDADRLVESARLEWPMLRPRPVPAAFQAAVTRGTRTTTGEPGPGQWRQRIRYRIDAELEPTTATLSGAAQIVYGNESPDTLRSLVLKLYQNVFAEGAVRNRAVRPTGGTALRRFSVDGRPLERRSLAVRSEPAAGAAPGWAVDGTLARAVLPRPLAPGDSVVLHLEWEQRVAPAGTFRSAWEDALGGRAFVVAQWYPQVSVYDDLRGWDLTPYLGDGEFYLPYADFEVAVTLPAGWLVSATGELENEADVLTPEARRRLAAALAADTVVRVVTEADLLVANATQPGPDGHLTWRFHARDVRDFAFAASDRYVWDATSVTMPSGPGTERRVAVHALYRPGSPHWADAAEFARHATGFLAARLTPYLYPHVAVTEGPVGGMEYPMVNFIGRFPQPQSLYRVIAHEVAHQWFPMMVGTNEAAYAWLDEGVASYFETLASADYFGTPPNWAADRDPYVQVAGTETEVPMMRHTDLVSPHGARVVAAYRKPATLFRALREVVGAQAFDEALRGFAADWTFRLATPWDFFNRFERHAGRDLDWFFHPWWFGTGVLDHRIRNVEGSASGTVTVTLEDRGDNPMPTLLTATTAAGLTVSTTVPVERWLREGRVVSVTLEAPGPVVRVELDPEQVFPDVDRSAAIWAQ